MLRAAALAVVLLSVPASAIAASPYYEMLEDYVEQGDYRLDNLPCIVWHALNQQDIDAEKYISLIIAIDTMIMTHTRNIHEFSEEFNYRQMVGEIYELCETMGLENSVLHILNEFNPDGQ